ncbi:YmdB family metallophosphoesterase [Patescibacteria group bacterium]|nr:YmdB family metallophosphoesterase [Patescibacteria group bacterium]
MKLLFIGDIVGRAGRQALAKVLPDWRREYQPDLIIANVDNLAHGRGVTKKTLAELASLSIDVFTGGDHVFDTPEAIELLQNSNNFLLRPLNYHPDQPGRGAMRVKVGSREILIVHLLGQVFMDDQVASPFKTIDEFLKKELLQAPVNGIVIDFHAEATSEKVALGWYLAGQVTAVLGSHTHVMTADERILPGGTAYLTDIGMTGAIDGVIGVKKEGSLQRFLTALPHRLEPLENGQTQVAAVLVTFSPLNGQAEAISRLSKIVAID